MALQYPKALDAHLPAPAYDMTGRMLSSITDFCVHHSDGAATQTVTDIDREHRNLKPYGDAMCGYTWVVDRAGKVWIARPLEVVPAAAWGRNTESVDAALIGAYEHGTPEYNGPPTAAQLAALEDLCLWAHRALPSINRTYGHGEIAALFYGGDPSYATQCPGTDVRAILPAMKWRIAQALLVKK